MLVARLVLKRLDRREPEAQVAALDSLLGAYRLDGHILGREFRTVALEGRLEAYVVLPARDAFETHHRNEYIEKQILKLPNLGLGDPELTLLSEDRAESNECECPDSAAFILFTTYLTIQSPVRCSDCFGQVPLYRLPRFESGEFLEVISWASDYAACDTLYMNSATGVRFGYSEISQFASSLSVRGRTICEKITQTTSKPVYYYLLRHQGRSRNAEITRKCPNCNGGWLLPEKWHNIFDFRCDRCRLVSNISFSVS